MRTGSSPTRVLGWLLILLFVLTPACSRSAGPGAAPTYSEEKPQQMAEALTTAEEPAKAVEAVREVLALGGIPTIEGETVLTRAVAPESASFAIPVQVAQLAFTSQNRATAAAITVADLGKHMAAMGWPFPEEVTDPGQHLASLLTRWVKEARANPKDPHNFTPLFLAEMAQKQVPSVDLTQAFPPDRLRLTFLELELLTAAFTRLDAPAAQTSAFGLYLFGQPAYADEPCSDFKKWVGGDKSGVLRTVLTEVGHLGIQQLVGDGLQKTLQDMGYSDMTTANTAKMLGLMNALGKIHKVALLYQEAEVTVKAVTPGPVHKQAADEALKVVEFEVVAGIPEAQWKDYKESIAANGTVRALRDCVSFGDLPTFADTGNIASDSANWRVQWRIVEGSPEHGWISLDKNEFDMPGQLQMKMKPLNEYSSGAMLKVDLTPERSKGHTGREKTAPMTVRASVRTSSPLSASFIANVMKAVLAEDAVAGTDAAAEASAGFFQEVVRPDAYGTLMVSYHAGAPGWAGTMTVTKTSKITVSDTTKIEGGTEEWNREEGENSSATYRVVASRQQDLGPAQAVAQWTLTVDYEGTASWTEVLNSHSEYSSPLGICQEDYFSQWEQRGEQAGTIELDLTLNYFEKSYLIGGADHPPVNTVKKSAYTRQNSCSGSTSDEETSEGTMTFPQFDPMEGVLYDKEHLTGSFDYTDGDVVITTTWDLTLHE